MISAERFLDLLEARDLLSKKNVSKLRTQIAQPGKQVSAESIARLLIQKGYLTAPLARRLLSASAEAGTASGPKAGEPGDELGLAPLEETREGTRPAGPPPGEGEEGLILLEEPEGGAEEDLILLDDEAPAGPPPAAGGEEGLLDELRAQAVGTDETITPSGEPPAVIEEDEEEELGLAPLEDTQPPRRPTAAPTGPLPPLASVPPQAPAAGPPQPPPVQRPPAAAAPVSSLLDEAGAEVPAGPLDAVLDPSQAGVAPPGPADPLAAPAGKRRRRIGRRPKKATVEEGESLWDTKLILIGGGALLGMLILLGILIWAFTRESGDEMFAQADEFYRQGSYTKAIANFDRYLEKAPNHPQVGLARVRRGLAQIRQHTEGSRDWSAALKTAQAVLPEIGKEKAFPSDGKPELRALLPQIAQGLAEKARQQLDSGLVAESREALALVDRYVSASQRNRNQLHQIEALLALTEHEIAQGQELDKAVAAMTEATSRGDAAKAYAIRAGLLKQYPRLLGNEKLRAATLKISEAQRSAVKWVDQPRQAETDEPEAGAADVLALAYRKTRSDAPAVEGHVVYALAHQAAYGLDAATGTVLWRRPVAFQTDGRTLDFPPTPVGGGPASDAILVDHKRHEILRVEAATGAIRWRFPVGEPFDAHPVITAERILVATRTGKLVKIELERGESPGYTQLPQPLQVGPTPDSRRQNLYQVADHSNLYVLDLETGQCQDVVYLGHEPGRITTSPVVVSRFLLVAQNTGAEEALLRVLSLEAQDKAPAIRVLQEVRVQGHVDTPPVVSGVRALVVTDTGELYVFEISASDADRPLTQVATGRAGRGPTGEGAGPNAPLVRYPLIQRERAWVAGSQLTRFDVHAARGRLQPRAVANDRSATLQPLVAIGQTVFHVRRKGGLPGVVVSAVDADGAVLWETHLAVPLAAEPVVQEGKLSAASAIGAIFEIDAAELAGQRGLDQPAIALQSAEVKRPVPRAVYLANGAVALPASGTIPKIAVFDPSRSRDRFLWIVLPDPLACPPVEWMGGLLCPCESGQVYLMGPSTGEKMAEPFQPPLQPGAGVAFREPAPYGTDRFVLADGRHKIYLVGRKETPQPHLAALAELELTDPTASRVAVLGDVAFMMDAANMLLAVRLPQLEVAQQWPLGGRAVWGPHRVGNRVMLATDDGQLHCLDEARQIVWQVPLPHGPVAGIPLELDGDYLFLARQGVLWRADGSTGAVEATIPVAQALERGPVVWEDRLVASGPDGTLYQVSKP